MATMKASTTIDRPLSAVFAYVDDWSNAAAFTQDLLSWEPLSEQTKGVGSRFKARMKVGPTTQETSLEITRWEQDAAIGWEPRGGLNQQGLYLFADHDGATEVTLTVELTLPGGIAGRLLGKTIEPFARLNVAATMSNLKRVLESPAAPAVR